MCEISVEKYPDTLEFVLDHLNTQKLCERAVEKGPYTFKFVADHFKNQGMCEKAVEKYPLIVILGPDWFVTQGQVKVWMITVIIVTMIRLLSGTTAIKNARPRKHKLRKS